MGDHLVLYADRLKPPETNVAALDVEGSASSGVAATRAVPDPANCISAVDSIVEKDEEAANRIAEEEEPLLQMVECRICQEEDSIKDLEIPCACSGSLKYAHRGCVQRWCNEKGDITCEICNEQFTPGYTAVPRTPPPDETVIDISGGWTITGTHDPRLLAMAAAQQHFLEAEYDEYASAEVNTAAFCRFAVLMLLALLLLRQALSINIAEDEDDDDVDASTYFSLFLLRAVGFLLPCYLMAWAINILQRRRQRQEEAALATTEVAFILQQAGQGRHLQFTISPDSLANPHEGTLSSSAVTA